MVRQNETKQVSHHIAPAQPKLWDAHGGDDVLAPAGAAGALRRGRERGGAAARLRLLCRVFPPPTLSRLK